MYTPPSPPFDGPGSVERRWRQQGVLLLIGTDEAGRGPLAGPVHAAAVCLDPDAPPAGLDDSKRLSARRRERLFDVVQEAALAYAIVAVDALTIDRVNILQASLAAMHRAVVEVATALAASGRASADACPVLVDGNRDLPGPWRSFAIVKGDHHSLNIAAASILAKVARDRELEALDRRHPGYDLARHKGYPTAAHREAIRALGPSPVHRLSFRGVREHCAADALPRPFALPPALAEISTRLVKAGAA